MGQNLFLNTVIWFLKFFAPLSLPFPDTEVTSFLSNDLELLEFIVPDRCSIILLFLFPWKKSLEKCWKKIVTASKARCSTSLLLFFFPFLEKFFKENRYRRIIYIFFPCQGIRNFHRIFFRPLFQNCEDTIEGKNRKLSTPSFFQANLSAQ